MAREVLVALFDRLQPAEDARRALERAGIPVHDLDLRSSELIGFASSDKAPREGGLWDWLFAREPLYRRHVEEKEGALLAVRADADDYDRVASLLLRHDVVAGSEMVPNKTSQSSRVRRYAITDEDSVPLDEEAIALERKR